MVRSDARILILGSFPGEESLRQNQYYGHAQNQFWKICSALCGDPVPESYSGKQAFLKNHQIALWDVLKNCSRNGSLDSAIKQGAANNVPRLLKMNPQIGLVLLNGRAAERYFKIYWGQIVQVPCRYVPSSSPAYAAVSLQRKSALWRKAVAGQMNLKKKRR